MRKFFADPKTTCRQNTSRTKWMWETNARNIKPKNVNESQNTSRRMNEWASQMLFYLSKKQPSLLFLCFSIIFSRFHQHMELRPNSQVCLRPFRHTDNLNVVWNCKIYSQYSLIEKWEDKSNIVQGRLKFKCGHADPNYLKTLTERLKLMNWVLKLRGKLT